MIKISHDSTLLIPSHLVYENHLVFSVSNIYTNMCILHTYIYVYTYIYICMPAHTHTHISVFHLIVT